VHKIHLQLDYHQKNSNRIFSQIPTPDLLEVFHYLLTKFQKRKASDDNNDMFAFKSPPILEKRPPLEMGEGEEESEEEERAEPEVYGFAHVESENEEEEDEELLEEERERQRAAFKGPGILKCVQMSIYVTACLNMWHACIPLRMYSHVIQSQKTCTNTK
jgi:hypothetical protein